VLIPVHARVERVIPDIYKKWRSAGSQYTNFFPLFSSLYLMAMTPPKVASRRAIIFRMAALYGASFTSLLTGAYLVHAVMRPDLVCYHLLFFPIPVDNNNKKVAKEE